MGRPSPRGRPGGYGRRGRASPSARKSRPRRARRGLGRGRRVARWPGRVDRRTATSSAISLWRMARVPPSTWATTFASSPNRRAAPVKRPPVRRDRHKRPAPLASYSSRLGALCVAARSARATSTRWRSASSSSLEGTPNKWRRRDRPRPLPFRYPRAPSVRRSGPPGPGAGVWSPLGLSVRPCRPPQISG